MLYPVFDENQRLIDTVLVEPNQNENLEDTDIKIDQVKNYIFGQHASSHLKTNDVIFITDKIVHSLALWDALDKPSLVINSIECLTPKVILIALIKHLSMHSFITFIQGFGFFWKIRQNYILAKK